MKNIVEKMKSQADMWLIFPMGVLFFICVIGMLNTVYNITKQQYRIRHYTATVESQILHTRIEKKERGYGIVGRGYLYTPCVEYSYTVDGQQYTSSGITVIYSNHTDKRWALETIAKFTPNKTVLVHYDPANPQESVLIYDVAFWPYHYSLLIFVVLSGSSMVCYSLIKIHKKPKIPSLIDGDYYVVRPDSIKRVIRKAVIICLFFYAFVIVLSALYYSIADKPYDLYSQIEFGIYFLVGFIILSICIDYSRKYRSFKSPSILISQTCLRAGEKVNVKVIRKFEYAADNFNMEMALVCTTYYKTKDKRGYSCIETQDCHISNSILCKDRRFIPGESLEYETEIIMPLTVHKSGFSGNSWQYPFYRWYFETTISQFNSSVYKTRYFVNCE